MRQSHIHTEATEYEMRLASEERLNKQNEELYRKRRDDFLDNRRRHPSADYGNPEFVQGLNAQLLSSGLMSNAFVSRAFALALKMVFLAKTPPAKDKESHSLYVVCAKV